MHGDGSIARSGKAPTGVLLMHGLCGAPSQMRFIAKGLSHAGHVVSTPQLAGHGGSFELLRLSTWQDWYHSAEVALDDLSQRCETVIAGGLSTGAILALMLAAQRPNQVKALALYSPVFWLNGRKIPWYTQFFRLVHCRWFADLIDFPTPIRHGIKDPRIGAMLRQTLQLPGAPPFLDRTPGRAMLERRWLANATVKLVERVAQPSLIIHPRQDDYAALSNASYLQRNLSGPVEMLMLDDSYHLVTIDRQRGIARARTVEFCNRIAEASGHAMRGAGSVQTTAQ